MSSSGGDAEGSELALRRRQSRDGLKCEEGRLLRASPTPRWSQLDQRPSQSRGWWETQTWHRECGQAAEGGVAGAYGVEADSVPPNGQREKYRDVCDDL